MGAHYTLQNVNGSRDVLRYMRFAPNPCGRDESAFDCHIAPEITHFIGIHGVMNIRGRDYEIRPGDIFVLPSNTKHRISRIDTTGEIENLNFDPAFIWQGNDSFDLNYLSIFDPSSDISVRLDRENPACQTVRQLLSDISDEFRLERYGYQHMVRMRLFMLLLTLIREFGGETHAAPALRAPNAEGIRATMRYIDEHLNEPLNVPMLSAIAGLSPNYYGTLFKQMNGITPVEYITSKRVLCAIELLPEFDGTMLELAMLCGFNSTASFNRAFRAYTGQVPSKYIPPIK